ncbi:hypothetical protein [Vibrio phage vB_VibM_10AMN]|uniref:Uncharacterized protein n=1 Tax=Staphylococcus phage vB_VibM_10AMN12 TaxID=3076785 RepID=A0AA96KTS0_9CAUD|nr:hypothetical protein [Vibrio phage vB_VibM_10AMN]WNO47579.1 hypothetical protein [Staphylococcus phage vB_VibM_10AMN12]
MKITETLESFGADGVNHEDITAEFYTSGEHDVTLVKIGDYKFTGEEIERISNILKFVDKMNKD